MTARWENPNVTTDSTSEPLRTLLRPLEALQPQIDAIDLDVDLNERDTYHLMVALGVSACFGDQQRIGDRWIKLGVLCEREVITTEQWLELAPAVQWRDREEGVTILPDGRPVSEYRALTEQERHERKVRRRGVPPSPRVLITALRASRATYRSSLSLATLEPLGKRAGRPLPLRPRLVHRAVR